MVTTRGVSRCVAGSGSYYHQNYTGRYARVNLAIIQMGFYFDYTAYNGGPGIITRSYEPTHYVVGGALSDFNLVKRSNQVTRLTATFSLIFKGFPAQWTAWMEVDVTRTPITRNN